MGLAELKALRDAAGREERTTGDSGVVANTPKGKLFDASDVERQHPDKHLRWVNLKNEDALSSRVADGYSRLSETEGGRHIGSDYALFAIPRGEYDVRKAAIKSLGQMRLNMHKTDFERVVAGVARELQARGLDITAKDLLKE